MCMCTDNWKNAVDIANVCVSVSVSVCMSVGVSVCMSGRRWECGEHVYEFLCEYKCVSAHTQQPRPISGIFPGEGAQPLLTAVGAQTRPYQAMLAPLSRHGGLNRPMHTETVDKKLFPVVIHFRDSVPKSSAPLGAGEVKCMEQLTARVVPLLLSIMHWKWALVTDSYF